MPNTNPYDVIIVGAGPAGISTALHLAQIAPGLARRTILLEKARHPRPKLCGGGILPDAEAVLQQLGLDICEVPHVDVDWAHFDFDGQGFRFRPDPGRSFAFRTIRRQEFDAWLVRKARERGFLIHENTTVKSITVSGSGVAVMTDQGEYQAAMFWLIRALVKWITNLCQSTHSRTSGLKQIMARLSSPTEGLSKRVDRFKW